MGGPQPWWVSTSARKMGQAEVVGFLTIRIPVVLTVQEVQTLLSHMGGHPNGARVVGAFGRVHDHDLHVCAEGGGGWDGQPTG